MSYARPETEKKKKSEVIVLISPPSLQRQSYRTHHYIGDSSVPVFFTKMSESEDIISTINTDNNTTIAENAALYSLIVV
jgi:hypothetical protein